MSEALSFRPTIDSRTYRLYRGVAKKDGKTATKYALATLGLEGLAIVSGNEVIFSLAQIGALYTLFQASAALVRRSRANNHAEELLTHTDSRL